MTKQEPIAAQSCGIVLFLSVMTDFVLAPPALSGTAQSAIQAVLLCTVLLCVLLPVFLWFPVLTGKLFCALYGAVFLFASASAFLQIQRFYTAVSDVPLSQSIVFGLLLLAALFAVSNGWAAIGRTGQIVLLVFLLSILFLLLGNLAHFRITNLKFTQNLPQKTLTDCVQLFAIPAEILLFCMPNQAKGKVKRAELQKAIMAIGGVLSLLLLCAELRLGAYGTNQTQPLYLLARMGGISVFKRTDVLHICAWLFAAMIRTAALLYGAKMMIQECFPHKRDAIYTALTALLVTVAAGMCSGLSFVLLRGILSVAAVLLLCAAICGRIRRNVPCANKN
ncbi:MAG: GerAB/ArcD/ProY family transporter [Ruthenibacterium sp.]